MTILPIVVSPDPRLKQVSAPVDEVTDEIRTLLDDMLETMYYAKGIGLSAVQVGVMKRVVVVDVEWGSSRYDQEDEDDDHVHHDGCCHHYEAPEPGNPIKMVNPEVIASSDHNVPYNEGCLSFPAQYSEVIRPDAVTVRYLDEHGKEQILEAEGLLATCIQHEIDHTNGITFVDHISKIKRDMILRKMKKAEKLRASEME